MAYFAQQTTEPAKTGRKLRGQTRDTSLWDRDPSAATAKRAPPARRNAQQTTSLWGSEQAMGGGRRTSRPNTPYTRTSLWGNPDEPRSRSKPQQPRRPAPWEPEEASPQQTQMQQQQTQGSREMFAGSAPAQTTYQGNAGAGSLIGELAIDLEAKFRTAHEAFLAADVDRSGALTIDELISVCRANQLPPDNVQAAMESIDVDRNGMIDYTEFARRLMRTANPDQKQQQAAPAPVVEPSPDEIKKGLIQDMVAAGASEEQIFAELARFDESRGIVPPRQVKHDEQQQQQQQRTPFPGQAPSPSSSHGHKYLNASNGVSSIFGGYEADAKVRRAQPIQPVDRSPPLDAFRPRQRKVENRNMRSTALW